MCACDNHKFKTFHPTVKTQRKDSERGNKGWATALSSSYNMKGNFFGLKQRLMGNFLENDFYPKRPPPLLSNLYMHPISDIWIKLVMWPQCPAPRGARQPKLS